MPELTKATLQALTEGSRPQPVGSPIPVQFNPASLRLQMANSVEGGSSKSRQARQYNGTSSTTLTVELMFDTAEVGTTAAPVSVTTMTNPVARFLLPAKGSKKPPPRVRFHWGDLVVDGVMTALNEDIDLFSSGGVPLRSKLAITIKEQDPRFTALPERDASATPPGGGGSGPGTTAEPAAADRARQALGGESPAEFAARNGLAPEAWRAVASAIDGLDLPTGATIGFSGSATASAGLGVHDGFAVGVEESIEAEVGLASPRAGSREAANTKAGFALSAAGGVGAAEAAVEAERITSSTSAARAAFGLPTTVGSAPDGGSAAAPARSSGSAAIAGVRATSRPAVDERAKSYGRDVPLRERIAPVAPARRADVTAPAWSRVPDVAATAPSSGTASGTRRCGCAAAGTQSHGRRGCACTSGGER